MANAVATASLTQPIDNTMRNSIAIGKLVIGASPLQYVTGGIACDLSQLGIAAGGVPVSVDVNSARAAGASAANTYLYNYLPGTTQANGVLQINTGAAAQTAPTELSAGNIPAGVSGDTIVF